MEPKLPPLPLDLDNTPSHLTLPIRAGELVRLLHQWGREVYAAGQAAAASEQHIERDWTEDASHENGNYQCKCSACGNTFIGHKRRVTCKACAHPAATDQPSAGPLDERAACVSEADIQAMAKSPHNVCRATEKNLKHALHVAMHEVIAIHEAIGFDPDETVDAEKIVGWIKQARASLTPTAPQAASQLAGTTVAWQGEALKVAMEALTFYRDNNCWSVTFARPQRERDLEFLKKSPDWQYVTDDGRGHEQYYVTSDRADEALRKIEEIESEAAESSAPQAATTASASGTK